MEEVPKYEDTDKEQIPERPQDQAKRFIGRICKRIMSEQRDDVDLIDDFGIQVMFDVSLNDLVDLEKELLKIGSFFIKSHEQVIDAELKEPAMAVDRSEICMDLLEMEHGF